MREGPPTIALRELLEDARATGLTLTRSRDVARSPRRQVDRRAAHQGVVAQDRDGAARGRRERPALVGGLPGVVCGAERLGPAACGEGAARVLERGREGGGPRGVEALTAIASLSVISTTPSRIAR